MEGQATWQQFGQRVNLLEAAIFFRQLFEPYANFLVDECLLRRAGKEMEGSTHGSLFDDTSPRQKIEARQEIGLAQDSQYFSWFRRFALRWAPGFLLLLSGCFRGHLRFVGSCSPLTRGF